MVSLPLKPLQDIPRRVTSSPKVGKGAGALLQAPAARVLPLLVPGRVRGGDDARQWLGEVILFKARS